MPEFQGRFSRGRGSGCRASEAGAALRVCGGRRRPAGWAEEAGAGGPDARAPQTPSSALTRGPQGTATGALAP